jgi:cell division protein FtsI (penicillin-binding protein 3)
VTPPPGGGQGRPRGPGRPPAAAGPHRPAAGRSRDTGGSRGAAPPRQQGAARRAGAGGPPGPPRLRAIDGGKAGPRRSAGSGRPEGRPRRSRPADRGLRAASRGGLRRGRPGRRLQASLWGICLALLVVAGRLVQLQGIDGAKYRTLAAQERIHRIFIPATRGSITTADGATLALTVQQDSVVADPVQIPRSQRVPVANALAGPLKMSAATLYDMLEHPTEPQWVVLAHGLPSTVGTAVSALAEPGITVTHSYSRQYPDGSLASNLVGFTHTNGAGDIAGQAGIEQSFNSLLAGKDGVQEVELGANSQQIPIPTNSGRSLVPGGDVRLTILSGLQYRAQQACKQRVLATHADNCTIVVMQPGTGKILAMAQYPTFQPADITNLARTVDLPVSAVFPPGSTAKVITAAAALEHGQTPMTPYVVPEQITVPGGFTFHDADPHATERLTLAGIVAHSSNVGMVQVAQHVSPQLQYHYYRAFGLGSPSGLPLPGASDGLLAPPAKWWGDQRYTLAFGQGVAATAVQMASVYATIANGGVRVQPTIVAGTTRADGRYVPTPSPHSYRVLQPKTAHELIRILQQVPWLDATLAAQPWGVIPGYSTAAKTGTAQIDACQCHYGSSYIGMAPATGPKVVVAVNVQHPRTADYFGNGVAGPAFYQVMNFALQTLKIPPDHGKRPDVRLTAP